MLDDRRLNRKYCYSLALLLFAELLIQDGNFLIRQLFGISDTSSLTFVYYFAVLIFTIYCIVITPVGRKQANRFIYFLLLFLVFGTFYLLYPQSRQYYGTNIIIALAFFIPTCVFSISNISNYDEFFEIVRPFTYLSIVLSLVIVVFFDYRQIGNYMEFSYALLPFAFFAYSELRKKATPINILMTIAVTFTLLVYGARATVMFYILYVLLRELFFQEEQTNTKRTIALIAGIILLLVIWIGWGYLQVYITQFASSYNSRFLTKLLNNELFLSRERTSLGIRSREAIGNMGFRIYGLFGDRQFLNGVYSHNIIYEILLSFGWIFGIILMYIFIAKSVKILFVQHDKKYKHIYVMFFLCLFAKFFVSASFIESGNFYIFIAIMSSIYRQYKLGAI